MYNLIFLSKSKIKLANNNIKNMINCASKNQLGSILNTYFKITKGSIELIIINSQVKFFNFLFWTVSIILFTFFCYFFYISLEYKLCRLLFAYYQPLKILIFYKFRQHKVKSLLQFLLIWDYV